MITFRCDNDYLAFALSAGTRDKSSYLGADRRLLLLGTQGMADRDKVK